MERHQVLARLNETHYAYQQALKSSDKLIALSQLQTATLTESMQRQPEIDCRNGCAKCCNIRVMVFPHEAVAMYFYIKAKLSKAQQVVIEERLHQSADKIAAMTEQEHLTTNVPCPMLIAESCSVYPARSLACAGYHSTDVKQCVQSYKTPTDLSGFIPQLKNVQQMQQQLVGISYQVLQQNKAAADKVEMIGALSAIFRQPSLINKWKRGRAMFKLTLKQH
ncbi:YkgJ family cysteine cluster protein [Motilimonas pumila]|uniref:YkgJ family cysteine cluster protein n=1 Tax=Motilimonas pumila TaxID=2303987 RepID=A0A418YF43_9GAMM|nr:YkgJ family cysteine cluster protein [Motilimonas pumila]RJG47875.1 hypothetical protein D1Z90_09175 [Motilimonas pumila]